MVRTSGDNCVMSDPVPTPLRGRAAETAALRSVLAAARDRDGAAIILVGSIGMGKSALLAAAAAEAWRPKDSLYCPHRDRDRGEGLCAQRVSPWGSRRIVRRCRPSTSGLCERHGLVEPLQTWSLQPLVLVGMWIHGLVGVEAVRLGRNPRGNLHVPEPCMSYVSDSRLRRSTSSTGARRGGSSATPTASPATCATRRTSPRRRTSAPGSAGRSSRRTTTRRRGCDWWSPARPPTAGGRGQSGTAEALPIGLPPQVDDTTLDVLVLMSAMRRLPIDQRRAAGHAQPARHADRRHRG